LSPCASQTLVPFQLTDDPSLEFDPFSNNLVALSTYVQSLCDMPSAANVGSYDIGDVPGVKNRVLVDKAIAESIVDKQLAYLFLHNDIPEAKFQANIQGWRRFVMTDREDRPIPVLIDQVRNNVVSSIDAFNRDGSLYFEYVPNITGGSLNPYISYKNGKGNASKTVSKLLDLPLDYAINELTLTYPPEISDLLVDIGIKKTEQLTKKCFDLFFKKLHHLDVVVNGIERKWVPQGSKLGVLENTHLWSSSNPLKPHLHHHCTLPSVSVDWSKFDKDLTIQECKKIDRQAFDDENRDLLYGINLLPSDESDDYDLLMGIPASKIESVQQHLGQDLKKDWSREQHLLNKYKKELAKAMGICSLPWVSSDASSNSKKMPLPVAEIKQLWFDCVQSIFSGIVDLSEYESASFDVFTKYTYTKNANARQQLLHWINYTKRSPSLDLNSFFRQPRNQCLSENADGSLTLDLSQLDDCYTDHISSLDPKKLMQYLQDLSAHKTRTRTLGFVRFINIFRVDPLGRDDKLQHSIVDDKPKFYLDQVVVVPYNVTWIYKDKRKLYLIPPALKPQPPPDGISGFMKDYSA
jgi:hypothetical protein